MPNPSIDLFGILPKREIGHQKNTRARGLLFSISVYFPPKNVPNYSVCVLSNQNTYNH